MSDKKKTKFAAVMLTIAAVCFGTAAVVMIFGGDTGEPLFYLVLVIAGIALVAAIASWARYCCNTANSAVTEQSREKKETKANS